MKTINFNVNNHVRVRLTTHGKECLRKNYNELAAQFPGGKLGFEFKLPKEDSVGWSEWQMWDLMYQLGRYVYNGCDAPFLTEIQIEIQ